MTLHNESLQFLINSRNQSLQRGKIIQQQFWKHEITIHHNPLAERVCIYSHEPRRYPGSPSAHLGPHVAKALNEFLLRQARKHGNTYTGRRSIQLNRQSTVALSHSNIPCAFLEEGDWQDKQRKKDATRVQRYAKYCKESAEPTWTNPAPQHRVAARQFFGPWFAPSLSSRRARERKMPCQEQPPDLKLWVKRKSLTEMWWKEGENKKQTVKQHLTWHMNHMTGRFEEETAENVLTHQSSYPQGGKMKSTELCCDIRVAEMKGCRCMQCGQYAMAISYLDSIVRRFDSSPPTGKARYQHAIMGCNQSDGQSWLRQIPKVVNQLSWRRSQRQAIHDVLASVWKKGSKMLQATGGWQLGLSFSLIRMDT